jgi:hypothetical protein
MRHLISATTMTISILFLIIWVSCEKESLPATQKHQEIEPFLFSHFEIDTTLKSRAGGDTVLFLISYSEDNVLAGDSVRTHRIFNQARIKYTKFVEDLSIPSFGIGSGVIAKNYQATEVFTNDSIATRQIHVAGATESDFTHFPNLGNNLLVNWHPATVVSLTLTPGERAVNFYRDQPINIASLEVRYDGVFKQKRVFMPWSKFSNIFQPGHRVN